MTPTAILAVGVTPTTAVGAAVLARPESRALGPEAPEGALAGAGARVGVVVGPHCGDVAGAVRRALRAGRAVLLEPIGRCPAAELAGLTALARESGVPAVAAFRRRHEPALAVISRSVASGAIGLPFAVQGEVLASLASDTATELLDGLDALCDAISLEPRSVHRLARPGARLDGPDVLSASLAGDASALLGVRLARGRASRGADRPAGHDELASVRLMGSHGTVTADLEAPALEILVDDDRRMGRRGRVHADAASVLVDAFLGLVSGSGMGRLVTLERAAELAALPGWERRAGGRRR